MPKAKVGSAEWMRTLVREVARLHEDGTELAADLEGTDRETLGELLERAAKVREAVRAGSEATTSTDLLVRGIDGRSLERFKVAAGARALKYSDYLSALVDLHDAMRHLADSGDQPEVAKILDELGLSTVTA